MAYGKVNVGSGVKVGFQANAFQFVESYNLDFSTISVQCRILDTDTNGNIFVGSANGDLYKYDINGNLLATYNVGGTNSVPRGLVVSEDGFVYYAFVLSSRGYVIKISNNLSELSFSYETSSVFATSGTTIDRDSEDNLYLFTTSSIEIINNSGVLINTINHGLQRTEEIQVDFENKDFYLLAGDISNSNVPTVYKYTYPSYERSRIPTNNTSKRNLLLPRGSDFFYYVTFPYNSSGNYNIFRCLKSDLSSVLQLTSDPALIRGMTAFKDTIYYSIDGQIARYTYQPNTNLTTRFNNVSYSVVGGITVSKRNGSIIQAKNNGNLSSVSNKITLIDKRKRDFY